MEALFNTHSISLPAGESEFDYRVLRLYLYRYHSKFWASMMTIHLFFGYSDVIKKLLYCYQSYSCIMRKVWYHQIWIQTYLGFIVLILKETTRKLYKPDCSFESPVVVCRAEFYVIFLYCHKENFSSVHSMVSYWAVTNVTLDPLIKKKIEKYILCKFGQKQ